MGPADLGEEMDSPILWTFVDELFINFAHRTRDLPGGQTPRADPATINPLEQYFY